LRPELVLSSGLTRLGHDPSGERLDAFMLYLNEIKRWNRAYSLTSIRTDREIVVRHFLDSCLYLASGGFKDADRGQISVADVGSGAGLPGIPIKILRPDVKMYLIESVGKKAAFLRHMARALSLADVYVIEKRVRDVRDIEVDIAVTRALFSVGDFVAGAGHIVREGGTLVLNKGPKAEDELKDVTFPYELGKTGLPHTDIVRNIITVRKGD
jgi:16S rRNA (guanine527-N7)-methyltransferase